MRLIESMEKGTKTAISFIAKDMWQFETNAKSNTSNDKGIAHDEHDGLHARERRSSENAVKW